MRKDLAELKELYDNGVNIIDWLKINSDPQNSVEHIALSYDLQAGNYMKKAKDNPEYENERASVYSSIINALGIHQSILEVGIGEATTFASLLPLIDKKPGYISGGFDISYSRVRYCIQYLNEAGISTSSIFVGDLFRIPIMANSVDIVYTNHTLEPNGGKEKSALMELYRITRKHLVLFEPSFELADDATKNYMNKHGYIKNLNGFANTLGYNVIENKLLFENNPLSPNNTAVTIIQKKLEGGVRTSDSVNKKTFQFACPVTKKPMGLYRNNYFCKESLLLYPVVDGIPCLLPDNAIVATHYLDDI